MLRPSERRIRRPYVVSAGRALRRGPRACGRAEPCARRPNRWCCPSVCRICPFTCDCDGLSSAFLFLLGAASTGISIFAAGYFRRGEGTPPGLLCLQYHLFLASMGFVLLADDAYRFMLAWETMALSSYFLVTTQHRIPEIRSAGHSLPAIAHVGAIAILLSFGVLQGGSWQFTFDAMRGAQLIAAVGGSRLSSRAVRLRREGGPGPDARVAAGSASGGALACFRADERRNAQDGDVRPAARHVRPARRAAVVVGPAPLALGLFTALYGVIFAAAQTDMKRLLAYSSIENIGIMFPGRGTRDLFVGAGCDARRVLA